MRQRQSTQMHTWPCLVPWLGWEKDKHPVSCHEPGCSSNVTHEEIPHSDFIISAELTLQPRLTVIFILLEEL